MMDERKITASESYSEMLLKEPKIVSNVQKSTLNLPLATAERSNSFLNVIEKKYGALLCKWLTMKRLSLNIREIGLCTHTTSGAQGTASWSRF